MKQKKFEVLATECSNGCCPNIQSDGTDIFIIGNEIDTETMKLINGKVGPGEVISCVSPKLILAAAAAIKE